MTSKDKNLNWSRTAVVYHIYPRSFKDGNGDGVGDLQGIISKLDYIAWLGAGAIWLSPVCLSPMADFGYDVQDYTDIDPIFGTLSDMDELIGEAHRRNIKVIMDFVPNHTSDRHRWFLQSRASKDSPKRGWYIWADGKDGREPNNWQSVFGGSGWQFDNSTKQYYYHTFLKEQSDLNWRNPEVEEAMKNVLRFWLDRGVDGFRVDAVQWVYKDVQLRDDPENPGFRSGEDDPYHAVIHEHSQGQRETLELLNKFCKVLAEYPDRFMVTELHADIADMMRYYRACGNSLHSPFNFNLIGMPWLAGPYKKFVDGFETYLEDGDWPNYVLGNHDKPRVASRLGQERARISALLQMTLRGMPFVYYGEEIGMENVKIPPELVQDPFEKRVPGMGLGRDPERTPMQWDASEFAGFSAVPPWLPVADDFRERNVEKQKNDPVSILSLYRSLISVRKNTPALLYGRYIPMESDCEHVFAFGREFGGRKVVVAVNFSEQDQVLALPGGRAEFVLSSRDVDLRKGESVDLSSFVLRGNEGCLLETRM